MATSIIFHQKSVLRFVCLTTQQWQFGFFFSIIRNDIFGGSVLVCVCVFRFFWSMSKSEDYVFKSFAHFNLLSTSSWYLQMIQDKGWIYFLEMGLSSCPVQLVDYYVDKSQHPCQKQDSTKVYTTLWSLHVILPIHVFIFVSVACALCCYGFIWVLKSASIDLPHLFFIYKFMLAIVSPCISEQVASLCK